MTRPEPSDAPTLTTERLRLVPFAPEHVPFLHELWTEPHGRRYLWDDRAVSRDEVEAIVEASRAGFAERGLGFWVVQSTDSGEPIGFVGLREFGEEGEIELLYGLAPSRWGEGLATEASRRVTGHAFEALGLARIHAGTDPPNTRSIAVIERLGMQFEGKRTIEGVEALYYRLDRSRR